MLCTVTPELLKAEYSHYQDWTMENSISHTERHWSVCSRTMVGIAGSVLEIGLESADELLLLP